MLNFKIVLRKLHQTFISPIWIKSPETLQFDTQNYCNLSCEYCNVQHSFNLPKGRMPLETIKYVLEYFGKDNLFFSVAPFMNGEPLLDERLPTIFDMAKRICNTQCVIDTNGTLYERRHMLIHKNLNIVRFTISAATPETYERVHGKPLFEKALATFRWFQQFKLPNQKAWLHFIATKDNEHEINEWTRYFSGVGKAVFPVHRSPTFQLNSEEFKTEKVLEPYVITKKGKIVELKPTQKTHPCRCWSQLSISWDGKILQCTDFPYEFNYGKVGEVDLLEAWKERLRNKMDNPCCNSCSLRFPNWKQTINRWIK